jgi:predicted transcriptional regulator
MQETTDDVDQVWRMIDKAGKNGVTMEDLISQTQLKERMISKALKELVTEGLIERSGEYRRAFFGNRLPVYVSRQIAMFDA